MAHLISPSSEPASPNLYPAPSGDRSLYRIREPQEVGASPVREVAPEKRFRSLARQWKKETAHLSSAARMARHPAYQEIIGMGQPVVPLLLAELKSKPDFWFAALRAVTGEDPVPPEAL